jgi:hypothetical protein
LGLVAAYGVLLATPFQLPEIISKIGAYLMVGGSVALIVSKNKLTVLASSFVPIIFPVLEFHWVSSHFFVIENSLLIPSTVIRT